MFLCPSREGREGPDQDDHWQVEPNGDRTCSWCGSLHEDDLIDILKHYVAGDYDYHFDPSTKSYKLYAHRPGVQNAKHGGIKFYKWHIDPNHSEHAERGAVFKKAIERFVKEFNELPGMSKVPG